MMNARIFLIPGLFLDRRVWSRVVPLLPEGCTPEFLDRPVLTGVTSGLGALRLCEGDALARIEAAPASEHTVIAGMSFGGYLAVRLAAKVSRPNVRVVSISGCAGVQRELAAAFGETLEKLGRGELSGADVRTGLGVAAIPASERNPEVDRMLYDMIASASDLETRLFLEMSVALAEPTRWVEQSSYRLWLMHARRDEVLPASCSDDLRRVAAGSRLVTLDSGSHLLPVTHAHAVRELLVTALTADE